jgi:hypothetical protein
VSQFIVIKNIKREKFKKIKKKSLLLKTIKKEKLKKNIYKKFFILSLFLFRKNYFFTKNYYFVKIQKYAMPSIFFSQISFKFKHKNTIKL